MSVENVVLENENEIEPEGENRETPIERMRTQSAFIFSMRSATRRREVGWGKNRKKRTVCLGYR